ncbi:MAG: hypothetical protein LBN29_07290 [Mediterranea sp.]|nr:hypothetical protein [Mediterranea sp.]
MPRTGMIIATANPSRWRHGHFAPPRKAYAASRDDCCHREKPAHAAWRVRAAAMAPRTPHGIRAIRRSSRKDVSWMCYLTHDP